MGDHYNDEQQPDDRLHKDRSDHEYAPESRPATKAVGKVALWAISPSIFSPKNANPFFGVGGTFRRLWVRRKAPKYGSIQSEYTINPEFAKVQPELCRVTRRRRNLYGVFFLIFLLSKSFFNPFHYDFMNSVIYIFGSFFLFSLTILTDFLYIVYKHAVVGLRLRNWLVYRATRGRRF